MLNLCRQHFFFFFLNHELFYFGFEKQNNHCTRTFLNKLKLNRIELQASSPAGLLSEFDCVDKTNPNCVLIGDAAENFSYQNLNKAFRLLADLEKPLLFSLGQG